MHYYGNVWAMPHMYGFGSSFLGLIFWIFVIYIFIKLVKNSGAFNVMEQRMDPVDILKERYAKGELNKEEFETMKKDLKD